MSNHDNTAGGRVSRRRFIRRAAGVMLGGGSGALVYAWRVEPHWVCIVQRELPIAKLPSALDGARLVQISDLHVGPVVDTDYITAAVKDAADLKPDLVAITGDFMTCRGTEQVESVLRVVEPLASAPLGAIAIPGNHDYGRSFSRDDAVNALCTRLAGVGVQMLRNEILDVRGLSIGGIDDLWGTNFAPQRVMPLLAAAPSSLVLCHNPDAADLSVWSGWRGWILAGHTHGGQCCAPLFGPPILPVKNKRYTAGEFDLHDGRKMYINPGLGYLRRVRFNQRPEITEFTLAPDRSAQPS